MQKQIELRKWRHTNHVGYYGISLNEFAALARFSGQAEAMGAKMTGVTKGPFGFGCRLQMSVGNDRSYELLLDGCGFMTLGRVEADGKRVRLCEGRTNTEAQWNRLLEVLKQSEGRLPV